MSTGLAIVLMLVAVPPSLTSVSVIVVTSMPVPVAAMPVLPLLALAPVIFIFLASGLHEHLAPHRIIHHSRIRRLLLLLDRKHGITGHLACNVPRAATLSLGKSAHFGRILLDRLVAALDQTIETTLAQQVSLHLLSNTADTRPPRSRSIVHPGARTIARSRWWQEASRQG
jgi:hypothetical protein